MDNASNEWLGMFDAQEISLQFELLSSKRLKREYAQRGYSHQISFYGVLTNKETEESQYSRIEVLAQEPFSYEATFMLYHFFSELKPLASYTIWLYSREREGVKQIGRFEKRG